MIVSAKWIFPDGKIALPVPGFIKHRRRLYDDAAPAWRKRLKDARDALGWSDEGIAIFTGYRREGVRTWLRGDTCPPRMAVVMMEALTKDPATAHLVAVEIEKESQLRWVEKRVGMKVHKRKLTPGWVKAQVEGKRKPEPVAVDLADIVGKEKEPD